MNRRFAVAAVALALATLASCGGSASSAPAASPGPASAIPSTPSPVAATPPPTAPALPSASASTPPGAVIRDATLLGILPPDIDGIPVTEEEASFAEAAADPAFAENVERAAFAIVAGPDDLASGVIAVLAPGAWDDTFSRDWRDTYNEGACAQAGGVVANAETELAGRTVYIATCAGGLRVYHAYIEERGILVSIFSLGEGRFGERLMAGLRP